jgi:hypothetical protein
MLLSLEVSVAYLMRVPEKIVILCHVIISLKVGHNPNTGNDSNKLNDFYDAVKN